MATNDTIMNAFDYDIPFGDLGTPIISDAYEKDILVVVEKHPDIPIRVGPRKTYITLNPYPIIPARILEIESGYRKLGVSPKERVTELKGLIEEALNDTKPLMNKINELKQNAKSLHSDIYAHRKGDKRIQKLNDSGGFDVIARGVDGLTKELNFDGIYSPPPKFTYSE